jgi:hypothetical protein
MAIQIGGGIFIGGGIGFDTGASTVSAPTNTVAPAVTGTATIGQTLSVSTGTWTGTAPITYTYQWKFGGTPVPSYITGYNSSSFTLTSTDWYGYQMSCQVTATNSVGSTNANSNSTSAVTSAPYVSATVPAISGTVAIGQVLTCSQGTWYGNATITYAYQWTRSGSNIGSATSSTYTLVSGDAGLSIACKVTATNSVGSTVYTTVAVATVGNYPSISAANEVFKFNYNTLASSADKILDNSSHAWGDGTGYGSSGSSALSQVSGGAYSGGGYYFYNDGTDTNSQGIITLTGTYPSTYPYATYANSVLINADWAFETNIWINNIGSYNMQTSIRPFGSVGVSGLNITQQSGSATAYKLGLALGTDSNDSSAGGININLPNLTGGAWKHFVVQAVAQGSGTYTIYVYVDGTLQNSGGTTYPNSNGTTTGLWAMAVGGAKVGSQNTYSGSALSYRLDNTRLVLGSPFSVAGFTAPTAAFTA